MMEYQKVAEHAARRAGNLLSELQGRCQVWAKGPKDFVTEADIAAQRVIRETLLGTYPTHGFIGEEDQAPQTWNANFTGYRWIVDPLDGTANFVHQLPSYAVSIALELSGQIIVGVVYDPGSDECYSAVQGEGASLNGEPIQVSGCEQLQDAMVAASFAPNVQRGSEEIERFVEMLLSCHSLRRLGSAALNLCYLAAGRLDAYWATSVKAWDVAAGGLIAREAGAMLTGIDGAPFDLSHPKLAGSANSLLHEQFLQVLRRAASGA